MIISRSANPEFARRYGFLSKSLYLFIFLCIVACGGGGGFFGGNDSITTRITPRSLSLTPGQTKTVSVKFTRNDAPQGLYPIRTSTGGLTVDPATFNADLSSADEVTQVLSITAPTGTTGSYFLQVGDAFSVYDEIPITVSDGTPDFTITASPTQVTVPNNTMSADVLFRVKSVNGFDGNIKVTWVADGGATPSPSTNDFTAHLTPSTDYTFTRKMYRFATHSLDIPITFNVTNVPFTKQRSVTVTVHLQP